MNYTYMIHYQYIFCTSNAIGKCIVVLITKLFQQQSELLLIPHTELKTMTSQ